MRLTPWQDAAFRGEALRLQKARGLKQPRESRRETEDEGSDWQKGDKSSSSKGPGLAYRPQLQSTGSQPEMHIPVPKLNISLIPAFKKKDESPKESPKQSPKEPLVRAAKKDPPIKAAPEQPYKDEQLPFKGPPPARPEALPKSTATHPKPPPPDPQDDRPVWKRDNSMLQWNDVGGWEYDQNRRIRPHYPLPPEFLCIFCPLILESKETWEVHCKWCKHREQSLMRFGESAAEGKTS